MAKKKSTRFGMEMDPALSRRLKATANRLGFRSVSPLVRVMIREKLDEYDRQREIAK